MGTTPYSAARRAITTQGPVPAARALLARQRFEVEQFSYSLNTAVRTRDVSREQALEAQAIVEGEIAPVEAQDVPQVVARLAAELAELRATNAEIMRRTTEHEAESHARLETAERVYRELADGLVKLTNTNTRHGRRLAELVDRVAFLETRPAVRLAAEAPPLPAPLPPLVPAPADEAGRAQWLATTLSLADAAAEAGLPLAVLARCLQTKTTTPMRVSRATVERIKATPSGEPIRFPVERRELPPLVDEDGREVTSAEVDAAIEDAFDDDDQGDERADTGTKRGA